MARAFKQRKKPCPACPYVKATPSGIWHADEYEKLRGYDDDPAKAVSQSLAIFGCHHTTGKTDIICQGWLDCHGAEDLLAVRLGFITGSMPHSLDYEPSGVEVWGSGNEAADNGEREIEDPTDEAAQIIQSLRDKQ